MSSRPKIVIALSGGVDSSVAAAMLVKQGYDVIGMMLRLWNVEGQEEKNRCCTPDAVVQARQVSASLEIPFYVIDSRDVFYDRVVQPFLEGYTQGLTPNPCMWCNKFIRWGFLLEKALTFGAEKIATGHYAKIETGSDDRVILKRGFDKGKDQSYVLSLLTQEQLSKTILPLGDLLKSDVRALAKEYNLPTAERPDSQDLCFLGDHTSRWFLSQFIPREIKPGLIVNRSGEVLGTHQGLPFYTIGQRKGIGLSTVRPYYVLEKRKEENQLVVGWEEELGKSELCAKQINWISGIPPTKTFRAQVKIRYKAEIMPAIIDIIDKDSVIARFDKPLRSITPGQIAVFYDDEMVLGGGVITP